MIWKAFMRKFAMHVHWWAIKMVRSMATGDGDKKEKTTQQKVLLSILPFFDNEKMRRHRQRQGRMKDGVKKKKQHPTDGE